MAELKYNNFTVDKCIGTFEFKKSGNQFEFSQPFVVTGKSWKELKEKCEKHENNLNAYNAPFEFKYGKEKKLELSPDDNTLLNPRARIEKIPTNSFGKKQVYLFTLIGDLPAEEIYWEGKPDWFGGGFVEMSMQVSYSTSRMITLTFTGRYLATADDGEGNAFNAHDAYDGHTTGYSLYMKTTINTAVAEFMSSHFLSQTFDQQPEQWSIDDQDNSLNFVLTYREVAVDYLIGAGGGIKYRLEALSFIRRIDIEMSMANAAGNPYKKGAGKYAEAKLNTNTFPKQYSIRGSVAIDHNELTRATAVSEWENEIRDWLITKLGTDFSMEVDYIGKEFIDYDEYQNRFSFVLEITDVGTSNLLVYFADFGLQYDRREKYKKVLDGKNHTFKVFAQGADATLNVQITVVKYKEAPAEKLFTAMYPTPEFGGGGLGKMQAKKGWRFIKMLNQHRATKRLDVENGVVDFYSETRNISFRWLEDSKVASAGAAIRDSKISRSIFKG